MGRGVPSAINKETCMFAKTNKACRHIRPSGRRCQSPALRSRDFCYHHESINAHLRTLHPPEDGTHNFISPMVIDPDRFQREPILADYFAKTRGPLELNFPVLEDSDAVQLALSMVLTALGQNRLELKRATTILYTLQIASTNAARATRESPDSVEDFTTDDTGQILAPDETNDPTAGAPHLAS